MNNLSGAIILMAALLHLESRIGAGWTFACVLLIVTLEVAAGLLGFPGRAS